MAYWKQLATEHDKRHILPWHLPRVAAVDQAIVSAEKFSAFKFPEDYRNFLKYADGWLGFHISTDLFGTEEFLSGKAKRVLDRREINEYMRETGFVPSDYIPIGSSDVGLEVFLLISPNANKVPGGVIWFVSDEIERFQSFGEFFSSMVDYNVRIANKMKDEGGA
jgi:cell wall assembly regulator SMI1